MCCSLHSGLIQAPSPPKNHLFLWVRVVFFNGFFFVCACQEWDRSWLLLMSPSCSSALGCSPCSTAIPFGTCSGAFCSGKNVRAGAMSVHGEGGWVCVGVCLQDPQAKPFGESHGGCSWAGINFKHVQGSARGCQAVICGWFCFSSSSSCSLSANASEPESQAAAENASLYLFHLFWLFFSFAKRTLLLQSWLQNQSLQGPGIAKQRFLTCPTYAKHRTERQKGEVMWKESLCCGHDKTEHQNQPGSGAGPAQLVGRGSSWKVNHVLSCRKVPHSAAALPALPTHFLHAEHVLPRKWG